MGYSAVYPALAQIRATDAVSRGGSLGARLCWNYVTTALIATGKMGISIMFPNRSDHRSSSAASQVGSVWCTEVQRGNTRNAGSFWPRLVEWRSVRPRRRTDGRSAVDRIGRRGTCCYRWRSACVVKESGVCLLLDHVVCSKQTCFTTRSMHGIASRRAVKRCDWDISIMLRWP